MKGDKTWICIEFEEEDIAKLEREGEVLGYCRVLIDHQRFYDYSYDRWRYHIIVKTSIGRYGGCYNDESDLWECLRDRSWLLYKERRAYGLAGPALEQIWVRLIPRSPIGQEEITKLENEGVETEYYTVVIEPDVGAQLASDFIKGHFREDKRFEVWGSDGTYKVCNSYDGLNEIVESLKRDGWRVHKSQTILLREALMMCPTMLCPNMSDSKCTIPDDRVQLMTWVRFKPPAVWRLHP